MRHVGHLLKLFKTFSEMEGSGLRLETQSGLHDEAAGVSEVDVAGISEHTVGELEVATCRFLTNIGFT